MSRQFYVGQVVEPEDLFFRDEFIRGLWEQLERQHVILAAPRRTGKTSVMTHMLSKPEHGWLVLYLNVQDIATPANLYLRLLDEFNTRDHSALRALFETGGSVVKAALDAVDTVEIASLKVALRERDGHVADRWKDRLDDLLHRIRESGHRVLVILDELPDMLLAMKEAPDLLAEFLAWFRNQRQNPTPAQDSVRWLIGGSINLMGTLDAMGMVDLMNDPAVMILPFFTPEQVAEFVATMLDSQGCDFHSGVPPEVSEQLGRPIPYFLQMATQELFRKWRRQQRALTRTDVTDVFHALVASPEARDKLQHYHSRISHYYGEARGPAYALLDSISLSEDGMPRRTLRQKYEEVLYQAGHDLPRHEVSPAFNELMLHLENDFYIVETGDERYDFGSGILKTWWRKYYA